jgi:D-arabinose 1-dehydrogenase-like Zn-dependent alcohol dehydrogenase
MSQMTAVQIRSPGAPFEVIKREIPAPAANQVRIKVQACGICHSDMCEGGTLARAAIPACHGPRGGRSGRRGWRGRDGVEEGPASGCGVAWWTLWSMRSLSAWRFHGLSELPRDWIPGRRRIRSIHDREERSCSGDSGRSFAGRSGPILCAGITTFNGLRHSGAVAGDLVAVQGLGGLGHLGIQFASKMGFHTVAIGRGTDKEPLALKFEAVRYLDTDAVNVAKELTSLGGASVILATAPDSKAMSALVDGLGVGGQLLVVGHRTIPSA